jgi:predicted RNase H-like nuclease (RuvC/YqgF family)
LKELQTTALSQNEAAHITEAADFRTDLIDRVKELEKQLGSFRDKETKRLEREAITLVENEQLKRRIDNLTAQLRDFKTEHNNLIKEVQGKDRTISQLQSEVRKLKAILEQHNLRFDN